jgi:hypothetical protein
MFTAESKTKFFQKEDGLVLPRLGKIFPFLLIFLYFLFSSGELLHIVIYIFKPKISQLLGVLLLGYLCFAFRRINLPRSILYPSLWILLSMFISALFSAHPFRSSVYIGGYIFNFIFYFLVPINFFQYFDSKTILKIYSLAFSCLGLYAVSQLVLSWFGIYDPLATQRIGTIVRGQGWTYEPSYYALYITAYVMFRNAQTIFEPKSDFSFKRTLKLLRINCFLLASTSTGVIFSYPAFFLVSLWICSLQSVHGLASYARQRILKFSAICCALGGILSWLFWKHFVLSFFKFFYFGFMAHGSFVARWEGIVSCFKLFVEYPVLGVGVGGVGPHLFVKNSFYDTNPVTLQEVESFDPTNVFTEILASLGIVGLVGFIALFFAFYRSFKKMVVNSHISQQEKMVAIALFISLIVMLFVLQFNQGLFRPYIWIHAGIIYGYLKRLNSSIHLS